METSKIIKQKRDYIFEILYYFRKSLPRHQLIYIAIFFIKFIPLFLITTNVSSLEDSNTTINSFFRNFLIIQNEQIPKYDYFLVCIVFYSICVLTLTLRLIIFIKTFFSSESDDDFFLNQETNKIKLPLYIKRLKKIEMILTMIIVFFSQHLNEFFYFGIFLTYFSKEPVSRFQEDVFPRLFNYRSSLSVNVYIICILNAVCMLYLFYICYTFIKFFSYKIIIPSYGFKWEGSFFNTIIYLFLWAFQGLYSVSFFYSNQHKKRYRLVLCCIYVLVGIIRIINHIRLKTKISSAVSLMCDFLFNLCFSSSIFEIVIYIFGKENIKTDFSLYKIIVAVINGFLITEVVQEINEWQHKRVMGKHIFSVDLNMKKVRYIEPNILENFFLKINKGPDDEDTINVLISIFQCHLSTCSNEKCNCRTYQKEGKELYGRQMFQFFKDTSKRLLLSFLLKSEQHTEISKNYIETLYVLQTSYELLVEKNYSKALYFSQVGLGNMKKLSIETLYTLYEIRKLTMKKFRYNPTQDDLSQNVDGYRETHKNVVQNELKKENYIKTKKIFFEEILYEKIKKALCEICNSIEIIINYKHIFNSKVKLTFSSDDIITSLSKYLSHLEHLKAFLGKYFIKNRIHTPEIEYLLSIFYDIFKLEAFNVKNFSFGEQKNKSLIEKRFLEQLKSYLILLLDNEKIVVKYLDLNLLNILQYSKIEIYEMNFSRLLPHGISYSHFEHMKKYIINTDPRYNFEKSTFLINKEKYVIPIKIISRFFPSFENPLCLINEIEISNKYNNPNEEYNHYIILLDDFFGITCYNKEFEKDFFLSQKYFENTNLNLTFCQLFGLNEDYLKKYFNSEQKTTKVETTLTTTIDKIEDIYLEAKDQLLLYNKKKINKYKIFYVKKAKVFSVLAKIEKVVQEATICNEWENNGIYYLNKLWDSKTTTKIQNKNQTISSNLTTQIKRNSDDLIIIKIELRHLENTKYFFVKVKSKRERVIDYGSPRGTNGLTTLSVFVGAQSSSKLSIDKYKNLKPLDSIRNNSSYNISAINGGNTYIGDPIPSPTTSKPMNSTLNILDLNQSINNSKETLFLGNFQANKVKRQKSYFTHFNEEEAFLNIHALNFQLAQTKKKINYIRITIILIYCCLFFIIIFNFTTCHKVVTNTLKVIEINSFANLLRYDMFSGAVSALRICFISDKIIDSNQELIMYRKEQTEQELIKDYHNMIKSINELIKKGEGTGLTKILHKNQEYSYLMPNWKISTKTSSYIDEIRYFHYYLAHFTVDENNTCRIREYFYHKKLKNLTNEQRESSQPSFEERIIYYIAANVISTISDNTKQLIEYSSDLLKIFYKDMRFDTYFFYPFILTFSLAMYGMVIYSIYINRRIFNKFSKNILIKKRLDFLFEREIFEFKQLISNYSFSECLKFEKNVLEDKTDLTKSRTDSMTKVNSKKKDKFRKASTRKIKKTAVIPQEMENVKNEEKGAEIDMISSRMRKCKDPSLIRYSFMLLFAQLIAFASIQVASIVLNLQFCTNSEIQNKIATAYFARIPKICEIYLYFLVTTIFGDSKIITKDFSLLNNSVANYYKIKPDYQNNDLYVKYGNTNFLFLWFEIYLYRTNLKYFINDSTKNKLLPKASEVENICRNNNGDFCIYTSVWYLEKYKYVDNTKLTINEILKEASGLVEYCRKLGNGINLSGATIALDLYMQQLETMYQETAELEGTDENIETYLKSNMLFTLGTNIQTTMKYFHLVEHYLVNQDMSKAVSSKQKSIIIFSIISILFCLFLVVFVLIIMVKKIDEYIMIIHKTANQLDVIINKYDNQ